MYSYGRCNRRNYCYEQDTVGSLYDGYMQLAIALIHQDELLLERIDMHMLCMGQEQHYSVIGSDAAT